MTGRVEQYNCDAILCPVGTFSPDGRQLDDGSACRPCNDGNTFLGATECQDAANAPFLEGAMEFFVLASLYTELEGKNWNKTDGWHVLEHILNNVTNVGDVDGSQIDYCSWHGVKCSANDKVIELNLGSNGLKGTVPNTVFDLPDLQILDLSRNPVTFLPDLSDISNSPQLESLSLSSTKVKTLQGIQYGAGLKHLFLDGLQLGGTMPKGVFQLKKLQTLHMQHSEVKGKLPAEVGFLSNLRV
jgi:Leucine-rich repeat (LRR) protein